MLWSERTILAVVLAFGAAARASEKPVSPPKPARERAFATIGGRRYHPFYARLIGPHAVVASGTVYCAIQDSRGRPVVSAYDVDRKAWSAPATAARRGLGGDAHGNPALYVDRAGRLHVFYGCHGRAMRHARTARPHDLTEWVEQKSPCPRATYPQVFRLADGTVCLFYRAGGHTAPWTLLASGDDCRTWKKPQRILEMRLKPRHPRAAAYAHFFPGREGKTIHCFWNYKEDDRRKHPKQYAGLHEAVYRFNIYYVRRGADGKWTNAAGEPVALPVSKAACDAGCMVYDSGDLFAYPGAHATDEDGRPYVSIRTGVQDWAGSRKVLVPMKRKFATWRGGKWLVVDGEPADDSPADVRAVLTGRGEAAYAAPPDGPGGISYDDRWFIFYRHEPAPTAIWLLHDGAGYADRPDGPVRLP